MSLPHADPISGSVGDDMEQIHGHQLENPKSDQLSDELADLLVTATEDDFDVDKLDSLLKSLDQYDSIPDSSFDPQTGYEEFQKRLSHNESIEKAAASMHSHFTKRLQTTHGFGVRPERYSFINERMTFSRKISR